MLLPRFTITEAAAVLRVSPRHLRRLVAESGIRNVGSVTIPRYRWADLVDITRHVGKRSA